MGFDPILWSRSSGVTGGSSGGGLITLETVLNADGVELTAEESAQLETAYQAKNPPVICFKMTGNGEFALFTDCVTMGGTGCFVGEVLMETQRFLFMFIRAAESSWMAASGIVT